MPRTCSSCGKEIGAAASCHFCSQPAVEGGLYRLVGAAVREHRRMRFVPSLELKGIDRIKLRLRSRSGLSGESPWFGVLPSLVLSSCIW